MTSITVQFDNLVTYQEIAAVSNISNPDLVKIGQELWIPLCRFSSRHQFAFRGQQQSQINVDQSQVNNNNPS
jgi:hypothetical protein